MREKIEKLWYDYFSEECSVIDTEEEKELTRKLIDMHETVNELLTKEQSATVEKYIETIYEYQDFFAKKSFFKGCKFTISFLLKTEIL